MVCVGLVMNLIQCCTIIFVGMCKIIGYFFRKISNLIMYMYSHVRGGGGGGGGLVVYF